MGDTRLDDDADVSGMVDGTLTIAAGARATVSGMVTGDVVVERGARVRVTGMVTGRVLDRGGAIDVTGMATVARDPAAA